MKLFVCVFLILMVLEEYNCGPFVDDSYYRSRPLASRWRKSRPWITYCGFGDYYYQDYGPYDNIFADLYDDFDYGTKDSKEIDASSNFLDKLLNKLSENSSDKPLAKSLDSTSTTPSEKSLDKLSNEPLIPAPSPMGDFPSESTADIDPPYYD